MDYTDYGFSFVGYRQRTQLVVFYLRGYNRPARYDGGPNGSMVSSYQKFRGKGPKLQLF
jgi:hypothetical protein